MTWSNVVIVAVALLLLAAVQIRKRRVTSRLRKAVIELQAERRHERAEKRRWAELWKVEREQRLQAERTTRR